MPDVIQYLAPHACGTCRFYRRHRKNPDKSRCEFFGCPVSAAQHSYPDNRCTFAHTHWEPHHPGLFVYIYRLLFGDRV